jgi:hypothetical protein
MSEYKVNQLSEEDLNTLAVEYVKGDVYIVNSEEGVRLSFGHMFMLMDPPPGKEVLEQIGAVYERYDKAAPRTINGRPMFFSMQLLHKADLPLLMEKIEAKQKALTDA